MYDPRKQTVVEGFPKVLILAISPKSVMPTKQDGCDAARQAFAAASTSPALLFLKKTGMDALKGADILRTAPEKYSSNIEYAFNPIAQQLKGVAQVLLAGFGTRVLYTQHGGFDTHANEVPIQEKLWGEVSAAIYDFYQDLDEHNATDNVVILVFSEFG